jgi:hypothetical protein
MLPVKAAYVLDSTLRVVTNVRWVFRMVTLTSVTRLEDFA